MNEGTLLTKKISLWGERNDLANELSSSKNWETYYMCGLNWLGVVFVLF